MKSHLPMLLTALAVLIAGVGCSGEGSSGAASGTGGGTSPLDAELAAWRAAGMEFERAAFIPDPIPDAENAALVFVEAIEAAGNTSDWPEDVRLAFRELVMSSLSRQTWNQAQLRQAELVTEHMAEATGIAQRARRMTSGRWPADYTQQLPVWQVGVVPIIEFSRVLAIHGRLAAHRGDAATALATAETLLTLSDSVADEPWLLLTLCRAIVFTSATATLEAALDAAAPAEADLVRLADRLDAARGPVSGLRLSINADAMFVGGGILAEVQAMPPSLARTLMEEDLAFYLRQFRHAWLRAAELPHARGPAPDPGPKPAVGMVSEIGTPDFGPMPDTVWAMAAQKDLVRLALLAVRRRQAAGAWPASLEELAATLPEAARGDATTDPFSGSQYCYERTDTGMRLWSVGQDGADDGGDRELDVVVALGDPGPAAPPAEPVADDGQGSAAGGQEPSNWRQYWQQRMRQRREAEQGGRPGGPTGQ